MTRWIPWAFAAAGLMSIGCSKAIEAPPGQNGPSGTGGDGQGGEGAATTTTGGGGGAGGQGGTVDPGPCGIDCSTIQVPACLHAVCDESAGQCVVVPTPGGEACDDGKFCTLGETCSQGLCQGGVENTCDLEPASCEIVLCSEASDSCSLGPIANDTPCSPEDLCQINTTCQSGQCVGVPKDCFFFPVPDSCKVGVCNAETGDCEAEPGNEGAACSDSGDLCMTGKTCQGGLCLGGTPKNCSAFQSGCTDGLCDPGTGACYGLPVNSGQVCLDETDDCNVGFCNTTGQCIPVPLAAGEPCAEAADQCNNGACDGMGQCLPVPANEGGPCLEAADQCNAGACNAMGQCIAVPANDGGPCNDGNSCTNGETCLAGVCQGGQTGGYVVFFSETFAGNQAGWTFVPGTDSSSQPIQEWQIGSAMASSGHSYGYPDPATDHTTTSDNGVAGVVLGGHATKVIHSMNYIESPAINTSGTGSVYLEFWRWLNSDYSPYMVNEVSAWNGSAWVVVWQSGGSPGVRDDHWTKISYDLTAHKNAAMKVRFGFSVGNSVGLFTVSSWNIDDIVIANQLCN